ncbi:Clavaminate synthase-like protein [Penicillium canariense]|uniref:Clavaminate synthase-like protein n=1 Tax=Penicillium canariense TaxID=189055 RepID=A0A9W9HX20_9EURO|nr:Clavaminate synthase-like protein [Penicillium canariense]KAJ5159373.1 Clavaminate synthase-like protein [Penicillium canariense]
MAIPVPTTTAKPEAEDFPPDVPVAHLHTIDLGKLQAGDAAEAQQLFEASRTTGAFYLDLRSEESDILPVLEDIGLVSKELFGLPLEEKCAYDVDKLTSRKCNGYKPVGRNYGGLAGQRDGFETYVIPKNGILGLNNQADFPRPPVITAALPTLHALTTAINSAAQTITHHLSQTLALPPAHNLKYKHQITTPSQDIIRLLKYQPQPASKQILIPHAAHTDMGSLTFLFTCQPGLQIQCPGEGEEKGDWEWVRPPREGHAIVNLGDSLSLLTNGVLRSCVHRVGQLPNRAMPTRYSFAYMVRPADHIVMVAPRTERIPATEPGVPVLTCEEWIERKYSVLRLKERPLGLEWMMTGQQQCGAQNV